MSPFVEFFFKAQNSSVSESKNVSSDNNHLEAYSLFFLTSWAAFFGIFAVFLFPRKHDGLFLFTISIYFFWLLIAHACCLCLTAQVFMFR